MDTMSPVVAPIDIGRLSGAARISGISLSSVSRYLSALYQTRRSIANTPNNANRYRTEYLKAALAGASP
jgi:hypothetical protein